MYNGIGLTSARGSGTNGFVQKNRSSLKPKSLVKSHDPSSTDHTSIFRKQPNKDILEHEKKRQIEIQCLELEDQLRDQDVDEEQILERVEAVRKRLLEELERSSRAPLNPSDVRKLKSYEVHQLAEAKEKANSNFAKALGIHQDNHVEGAAFDPEVQERLKMERRQAREKREAEWEAERLKRVAEREERRKRQEEERKARREAQEAEAAERAKKEIAKQDDSVDGKNGTDIKDEKKALISADSKPTGENRETRSGRSRSRSVTPPRRRLTSRHTSPSPKRGRQYTRRRHSSRSSSRRSYSSSSNSSYSSDDKDDRRGRTRGRKRHYSSSRSRSRSSSRSSRGRSYSRSRSHSRSTRSSSYSSSRSRSRSSSYSSRSRSPRYRRSTQRRRY